MVQATTSRIAKVLAYWNPRAEPTEGSVEPSSASPGAATWMTMILRFGLACAGLFCWDAASQLFESNGAGMQALTVVAALGLWLLGLLLFLVSARRRPDPRLAWLILLASLLIFASDWQAQLPGQTGGATDVWLFSDYSAQVLRAGHNPYAEDMAGSFWVNRTNIRYQTPLLNGDLTTVMPYPALAFLIFVPFQWAGLSTQLVYPLFLLLTIIALFLSAPPQWRPIAVLPLLMTARFTGQAFGGSNDIVWAFFLVMMIWAWKRPGQRAMWFGLACAFKEQPWLLAPFLLIRLWHESRDASTTRRWRSLLEFAVVASTVFLVFNAPFIVWNAPLWWNRIGDSFSGNLILLGQGLASLTLFNVVTIPKAAFLLFMMATYGVALILYFRHFDGWREAMWLVPGAVFWLGHRSLNSYWFIFVLPFIAALLRSESFTASEPVPGDTFPEMIPPIPLERDRRPFSLALLLGLVVFIVGSLVVFKLGASPINLAVAEPIQVDGGSVSQLQVQVVNHSHLTLTPRFSVLGSAWQPFFWHIDQGPATLDPGAGGTYSLSPSQGDTSFGVNDGAEVIMTDVTTDDRRASAVVAPDLSSQVNDPVPNGDFLYWDINTQTPYLWGLTATDNAPKPVQLAPMESGRRTLQMTLPPVEDAINWSSVALRTWIPFPLSPIQIWVKPPPGANRPPNFDLAYGLELAPTGAPTRVWVLFGGEAGHGQLAPD